MKRCVLLLGIVLAQACAAAGETPAQSAQSAQSAAGIGYPSVEAAFSALKADPQAQVVVEGDWMVFTQQQAGVTTTWRFTRPGHSGHPSVMRKREDSASGTIEKATLCQSIQRGACATLEQAGNGE